MAQTPDPHNAIAEYKLSDASVKAVAVDSEGRRLFLAAGDGITVLNADTGTPAGTMAGLKGAHDVLLIPAMNGEEKAPSTKGFASDAAGHVIAFSLADLKPSATIQLATSGPVSLCYDTDAKTVEAVSTGGSLATIDADTGKVLQQGKIVTGAGQVVCGNMDHVYVADPAANVVHVLNHATMKDDGVPLPPRSRRRNAGFTFIELKGGMGAAHETFAWLPQGKGQWKAAAFIAQEDGTLSGIRMMAYINYTMGGQYKLGPGLGSIAYDDKTHHLFIASMDAGSPVVVVAGY